MKKVLFFCLMMAALCPRLNAQDQMFKSDNTRILVKIVEVGPREIKYKLYDNLSGPTFSEKRENVGLIIYQNGDHEVIKSRGSTEEITNDENIFTPRKPEKMTAADSLTYYGYSNSISINFLNFINNEIGIIYRREFFDSQFNIILPFAVGLAAPGLTQNTYFGRGGTARIDLGNKVIEAGLGIHYYPSLRNNINYYIGPMMRFMQYNCTQTAVSNVWGYALNSNNTTLTRYAFTITNGFILRTRSRLTASFFGSIGFKRDEVADPLTDAFGATIITMSQPLSLYWWSGFEVGFNF